VRQQSRLLMQDDDFAGSLTDGLCKSTRAALSAHRAGERRAAPNYAARLARTEGRMARSTPRRALRASRDGGRWVGLSKVAGAAGEEAMLPSEVRPDSGPTHARAGDGLERWRDELVPRVDRQQRLTKRYFSWTSHGLLQVRCRHKMAPTPSLDSSPCRPTNTV